MKITRWLLICGLIITSVLIAGCGGEAQVAKAGDTVSVHYTLTLEDGTEKESSKGGEPLSFTVGAGQMITGFDNAVVGMKVGETKMVTLPPEEAYGNRDEDKIIQFDRAEFEEPLAYNVGDELPLQTSSGYVGYYPIVEITDDYVAVDTNSELAGETLTFEIELVSIEPGE